MLCMAEVEKTNVTLRINKEVIEKARELGLNLSSITENMLKTENLLKDEGVITPKKIREAYRKVFLTLLEILKEWGTYVKIGEHTEDLITSDSKGRESKYSQNFVYYLSPQGMVEVCFEDDAEALQSWGFHEDWPVNYLFDPEKLIENIVDRLYTQSQENKEKMQKLTLLKNVLEKIASVEKEGEKEK